MNKTFGIIAKGSAIVLSVTLLAGCKDFFSGKKEEKKDAAAQTTAQSTGTVLASINGKPVIRESDFMTNINQMLQANPYFRGAGADALPMSIKRKFFDELVKQELILADADKKNIAQDADFVKEYNAMMQLVKRSLTIQFFEKKLYDGIKVSDGDINSHYAENKSHYIKDPGGIAVVGARCDSEQQANKLVEKTKKNAGDFENFVKNDKNVKFKNFGRISKEAKGPQAENSIPASIKEAVFAMQNLPKVEKVKVGDAIWVIAALDSTDASFFDLNEIKPQIENIIKNNEFKKILDNELKSLRAGATIDINEDYFKEPAPQGEQKTEGKKASEVAATEVKNTNAGVAAAA